MGIFRKKNGEARDLSFLFAPLLVLIALCAMVGTVSLVVTAAITHDDRVVSEAFGSDIRMVLIADGSYTEENPVYTLTVDADSSTGDVVTSADKVVSALLAQGFINSDVRRSAVSTAEDGSQHITITASTIYTPVFEGGKQFLAGADGISSFSFTSERSSIPSSQNRAFLNAYAVAMERARSTSSVFGNVEDVRITSVDETELWYDPDTLTTHSRVAVEISVAVEEAAGV